MLKIALICQYGASTGMFASKMRQAAKKRGLEIETKAFPDSELDQLIDQWDIILLGPQVGFKKDDILRRYPHYEKRLFVIDAIDFGMMNGEKILKEIVNQQEES